MAGQTGGGALQGADPRPYGKTASDSTHGFLLLLNYLTRGNSQTSK